MMKRSRKYKLGVNAPYHKLTEREVKMIRAKYKDNSTVMWLSREFDVSPKTIRDIVQRHTWRHVK